MMSLATQTVQAQGGYEGCYYGYAPARGGWQQPMSYQPAPSPPGQQSAKPGTMAVANGRTAQSNTQTYQSFSAQPAASTPTATYPVQAYPTYAGNNGYYGAPLYGGNGYSQGWRSFDNAHDHGVNPNAYP